MAKKYRKNHRKTVKTERVQTAESSSQLSVLLGMAGRELGMDGYSNAAAFLGDDSPLLSAGTFARNTLTSNPELLTTMYRVNWLCKRIIDMPTEDMTRAWYKLSTSVSEEELHDLKRLEAKHTENAEHDDAPDSAACLVRVLDKRL